MKTTPVSTDATKNDHGGWDEEPFTGTGFPNDFYIRYHLYALHFPVMALGRYLRREEGTHR